jgi:trans-AT polyketide synthase/acyltransferase/oxidoreductase domain-containing protein
VFEEASEAIGEDLAAICFQHDPRLSLTEYTQPCLLTAEVAAYRVATEEFGLRAGIYGGHSLGEYAALVVAGAIPFAIAVRLVRARGIAMERAVPAGEGGMAALMLENIESSGAPAIVRALGAEVTNRNSPDQLVVSGLVGVLEAVRRTLKEALPALEYVPLRVSTPFHSSLMRSAEAEFRGEVEACATWFCPERAVVVTSNATGGFHQPDRLVASLVSQISSPVRWLENMEALAGRASPLYEIGPRTPLTRFFRALGHQVVPLTTLAAMDKHRQAPEQPDTAPTSSRRPPGPSPTTAPDPSGSPGIAADLGDPSFRRDYGARLAYVVGGLGWGIGPPELVSRAAGAGLLAFLGTAGLTADRVAADVERTRSMVAAGSPWGLSVASAARDPSLSDRLVELALRLDVPAVEVADTAGISPQLVRYRLRGCHRDADGRPQPARRLLAKVDRLETAVPFLGPAPSSIVRWLEDQGELTAAEAELGRVMAMADDVCACPEVGASPGLALNLLPVLMAYRDERNGEIAVRSRIGIAGGLGSPQAVAAAFVSGADFVVTGSVNQVTVEAGTSPVVKDALAAADIDDFTTAPDPQWFELGGRAAVLGRGLLFPARAEGLYRRYLDHGRADELHAYLRRSLAAAMDGDTDQWLDFQVPSSTAVGAFNRAVSGSRLEDWRHRHVDEVATFLMAKAAAVLDRPDQRTVAGSVTRVAGVE